jgi:outer membrane protein assembly factor BamB
MTRKFATLSILALGSAAALAMPASAATLAALTGDNMIHFVDSATLKNGSTITVKGAPAPLAGIDVRPADGMLYGVSTDGTVMTIDAKTGQATVKSRLESFVKSGVAITIDFNPAADRLRIIGADGTNLRANVDDGKVTTDGKLRFADGDANKDKAPSITAGAYSNSFKGTKETALYDIDTTLGVFLKQAPPNDGVLATIGMAEVKGQAIAFDIESDGAGNNTGWLVAGDRLMKLDIATGKTMAVGKLPVKGQVRDIAVMPAM